MTFRIRVDAERWHAHTTSVRDDVRAAVAPAGDLVPVAKGNGYGLGNARLLRAASRLGSPAIAVGTVFELLEAAAEPGFDGDLVVLEPFEPRDEAAAAVWATVATAPWAERVVRTVAGVDAVAATVAEAATTGRRPRVLLEGLTSVHRFGLDESAVAAVMSGGGTLDAVRLEGLALHLPMVPPASPRRPAAAMLRDVGVGPVERGSARAREVVAWGLLWTAWCGEHLADVPGAEGAASLWVSHLDDAELGDVRLDLPDVPLRPRIGTRLWLGDRGALTATGTVLAVHRSTTAVGYRQRRLARGGAVVVVSGGTTHGVALEAPSPAASVRQRAVAAGTGTLEAFGRALSPFRWQGHQLWFVEPPHMHVSLVRLPAGVLAPEVGTDLEVDVRYTTARPDRVVGLD